MKAVLFDFGGTIDTNGVHWSEMYRGRFERAGMTAGREVFDRAFVESEQLLHEDPAIRTKTFLALVETQTSAIAAFVGSTPAAAAEVASGCYEEVSATIAQARKLLEAYAKTYALGLVSNFYGNLAIVCREFDLEDLFKVIVDSGVEGVRKPDPGIFTIALARLGAEAPDTFMVGDSYDRDVVPAKALGCKTIWLRGRSWTNPADTTSADYTITSFEAARSILMP